MLEKTIPLFTVHCSLFTILEESMSLSQNEKRIILAMIMLPGLGPVRISGIINTLKAESVPVIEFITLSPEKKRSLLNLPDEIHSCLESLPHVVKRADFLLNEIELRGISALFREDSLYPERLKAFMKNAAPLILFCKGNLDLLSSEYTIGIIGTRSPGKAGISACIHVSKKLSGKKITVVSGGAIGIDTVAHEAALEKGATVFILPRGLFHTNRIFSLKNKFTETNHLIVSEFPPDYIGNKNSPLQRNRTVAALSDAMIVCETAVKGGAMHTANHAKKLKKSIFALDFTPEKNPEGNKSLIESGAIPIPAINLHEKTWIKKVEHEIKKGKDLQKKNQYIQQNIFD
jgi:DNA protecting protein DprA